jgi:lipid A ethanolaminephosphotransferase
VALFAAHFLLMMLPSSRWTVRPVLSLAVVATALAAYYADRYGVLLDPAMLRNIMRTDPREAREFVTFAVFLHTLTWSALPLGFHKLDAGFAPDLCDGADCLDDILVRALENKLAEVPTDTVVVLHLLGNHGPAYHRRYPPAFRRFTPDCQTAELRDCTREEVVNAYDNAILYTDHVLAEMIDRLQAQSADLDTALLYVSDHGESLGEAGLYLHGIPYAIAPRVQTHVPMISWSSPGFAASSRLSSACLATRVDEPLSHDHLFHSVLGVLDVATSAYRRERDLYAPCRVAGSEVS